MSILLLIQKYRLHRTLAIAIVACGLLLAIIFLGFNVNRRLLTKRLINVEEFNTRLNRDGNVTFKPPAVMVGGVFLRVDNELVFDCYYDDQGPKHGVFAVTSLDELIESELSWIFKYNTFNLEILDQYNVDRSFELLCTSNKSYIALDSPYLQKLPRIKQYPIIDASRATHNTCVLVYIPYTEGDTVDSWLEKEEAIIEAWIGDKHMKIDIEYPSPRSRKNGYHGICSGSEIFLLDTSIAVVIQNSNHYNIVHSDCDTTTTTELIITLKDGEIIDNRRVKLMCDDGNSLYVAYIDKDNRSLTEGKYYVVVKNTISGIQINQPWDDVVGFHSVSPEVSMEWFDDCLIVLNVDYEVSVFRVQ